MKNRIPDYLPDSRRVNKPSEPALQDLSDRARKQFISRIRQAETQIRKYPISGLGAALFLGMVLGWMIKRK